MAEVQTLPDYPRGLDFQQVWAALMEDRERLKETEKVLKENDERFERRQEETRRQQEETARLMEETRRRQEETARQIEETNRQMKETDRQLGKLGNRFGDVIEHMVAPNLRQKFKELGYTFPKVNQNSNVSDFDNDIFLENDFLLENGDMALLVEVKVNLTTEDVKEHIERLEKMRKYADLHGDKRTFLGAVAGVVMTENVRDYALKQGFFVIEPSGETFNIIPPKNEPKEW